MANNPSIKPRRGTSTPGVGAILQNELAIDTTNKRIFIGAADGSGTLIGSAPGGSDTQVQFNDGGVMGGDAGLSYNKTTDALTVAGDFNANGGAIKTTQATFNLINGTATTLNIGGGTTAINMGGASCTTTIGGGTLVGTLTTQNVFNSTATTVNFAGAATALTMGATSGTAAIRNATLRLGNTTSTITTNATAATNNITMNPYGKIIMSPVAYLSGGGSIASLTVEASDGASGVVEISGGDLYLGRKTADDANFTPVNIIFEGPALNAFDTTLTVETQSAARTITLPDATGTVALLGTGSTTDGRLPYYDTTTKTFLGTTYLSYDDATNVLTLNCADIITGSAITTTNSTVSLLNATATTINFGGAATTFNIGGAASATINLGKTDGTTTVDMNSNVLREVELRTYFETKGTSTYTGGMNQDLAVDLSTGNVFVYTTTGSISTFTVNNIPSKSGISVGFTVVITCGNALYSVNFDSFTSGSIVWAGGTPPTATNTANRTDIVSYVTYDGGTTWYGMTGGLNFN